MKKVSDKELDDVFSKYVRNYYSYNGVCVCYTCEKPFYISEIQNGHGIVRGNHATRWNIETCRPQCQICNYDANKEHLFTEKLIAEIGEKRYSELKLLSRGVCKMANYEKSELLIELKRKLKELLDEKC